MRHAYVDRNFGLDDPAFVIKVDKFLPPSSSAITTKIDAVKATPSIEVRAAQ